MTAVTPSRSAPGAEELHRVRGAARGGRWHLPALRRLLQHPAAAVRGDGGAMEGTELEVMGMEVVGMMGMEMVEIQMLGMEMMGWRWCG